MVNGIGQALAAIGRSIGPALGAPVFAWSESTGEYILHNAIKRSGQTALCNSYRTNS